MAHRLPGSKPADAPFISSSIPLYLSPLTSLVTGAPVRSTEFIIIREIVTIIKKYAWCFRAQLSWLRGATPSWGAGSCPSQNDTQPAPLMTSRSLACKFQRRTVTIRLSLVCSLPMRAGPPRNWDASNATRSISYVCTRMFLLMRSSQWRSSSSAKPSNKPCCIGPWSQAISRRGEDG